ncbi:hypothetical protein [Halocatena marina]|uniref:hypothetical protein n=1 Tax=Halocatena marina TaxID=2934937 RepID=UPI0036F1C572
MALIGGGAGAAAAGTSDVSSTTDNVVVVNDDDLVDVDDSINDINSNVLGIANQDSPVELL